MSRAEIYRRAAEAIDRKEEEFSCCAVSNVCCSRDTWLERKVYSERFASQEQSWGWILDADDAHKHWGKKGRVIALCFAAAMAETGDL